MYIDYLVRKLNILLIIIITVIFIRSLTSTNLFSIKEYQKNIVNEVVDGIIIDSSKTQMEGLFGGNIIYETAIKIDEEIIISNNKEIYYKTKDKIKEEVKVEIENNKNLGTKKIIDIKFRAN